MLGRSGRARPRPPPPALTPLPLSCRNSHASQGSPAECPGLRTKGEARGGGLHHLLLAAGLARAFGPFALGGLGRSSSPGPCGGARPREEESRRAAHVSRSGAAAARRVPVGKALLPSRVRLGGLSPESNVVAAAVAPIHSGLAHHCRYLRGTL